VTYPPGAEAAREIGGDGCVGQVRGHRRSGWSASSDIRQLREGARRVFPILGPGLNRAFDGGEREPKPTVRPRRLRSMRGPAARMEEMALP